MGIIKRSKIKEILARRRNNKRIKEIDKQLRFLAGSDDIESRVEHEKILVAEILGLSTKHKEENSPLTQPLHLYFASLYHKGRLSIDKSSHNESIELFTEAFTKHPRDIKNRFYFISLQKVLQMLITANLSIHRVQHANKLLVTYNNIFFESYKALLYTRILMATCGTLDMELVRDLFRKAADTYEKECTTVQNKTSFVNNIYMISKGTGETIPGFEDITRDLFEKLRGDCEDYAVRLFCEFCYCNEYLRETKEWLDSLDVEKCKSNGIHDVFTLYYGRINGEVEILKYNKEKLLDRKEILELRDIRNYIEERDYSLEKLLDDIDSTIEHYSEKSKNDISLENRLVSSDYEHTIRMLRPGVAYWRDFEHNYLKVTSDNNTSQKDKVIFFVNEYSLVNGAVTFPFLLEARRRGISCYSISPRIHLDRTADNDDIRNLYGLIVAGHDKRYYPNKNTENAELDIDNKRIIVQGMNVYQPIFEFITRYQFTYFYNYENDAWARYRTTMLIRTFDGLFRYIKKIEEWAKDNNKKVYFISNAPHLHNAAAFRIYCEQRGYKNGLNYICTSPGYDNYFANANDPRAETTTALNLTTHLKARNSFLGTEEGFNRYYEDNRYRLDEIREKMRKHLEAQRGRRGEYRNPKEKESIRKTIEQAKSDGKKIIMLNGKVIIDLAVKYTQGIVHSDMSEWITHAVEFSKAHEDKVLLLIKPHPHENREDLTLTSEKIDNLKTLIKTGLGDNTIYLDNDMFTNHELVELVDLGMVWNGTSALEFAAQDLKVLVADVWGHFDYPIGFAYPKSLQEYESCMLNPDTIKEPKDIKDRAITFLEYMGSDDVRIPNAYSETTLMNFNQYDSTVNEEAVDIFVAKGDDALESYFDKTFK